MYQVKSNEEKIEILDFTTFNKKGTKFEIIEILECEDYYTTDNEWERFNQYGMC